MFQPIDKNFDYFEVERRILEFWKEQEVLEKLRAKYRGKRPFSFIDGPITANNLRFGWKAGHEVRRKLVTLWNVAARFRLPSRDVKAREFRGRGTEPVARPLPALLPQTPDKAPRGVWTG